MAKWLDKITKVANQVSKEIGNVTESVVQTYQEQDLRGLGTKATQGISDLTNRTQEYFKNIGDNNKEIMSEVETKIKESEEATVNPKVASIIAATLNTTQTIAGDIVNVGKKVINNISSESNESNAEEEAHIVYIDNIPLETILKEVLKAENVSPGAWKVEQGGQTYFIIGQNEWWSKSTNDGDVGAISLMSHYISVVAQKDFKSNRKELDFEAIGVLKNCFSETPEKVNTNDMDNPSIKTNKETSETLNPKVDTAETKVVAKKATKTARKTIKTTVKANDDEKTTSKTAAKKAVKTVRKSTKAVKDDTDKKTNKLKP